jgi:hypothetical protein
MSLSSWFKEGEAHQDLQRTSLLGSQLRRGAEDEDFESTSTIQSGSSANVYRRGKLVSNSYSTCQCRPFHQKYTRIDNGDGEADTTQGRLLVVFYCGLVVKIVLLSVILHPQRPYWLLSCHLKR